MAVTTGSSPPPAPPEPTLGMLTTYGTVQTPILYYEVTARPVAELQNTLRLAIPFYNRYHQLVVRNAG